MHIAYIARLKKTIIFSLSALLAMTPLFITFEAKAVVAYPVTNTSNGETFSTIQAAIDDDDTNDGDTIKVDQGNTFNENLVINKELTIKSDNKWGTKIITQGAYRGVDIAANNVTLEGFKILLPAANDGTAWHLKISAQSNVTLRDIVMYGTGKNSGYTGPNNGITGIDINSAQNITLDRVFVEHYNKNGIAVTARQTGASIPASNITFKDTKVRANGMSDGWAGIAFYTTSSQGQPADISGIQFMGENLIAWNPMGVFVEGSGGVVSGNGTLDFGETVFNDNKYDLVNAQLADAIALNSFFDGRNGINSNPTTLDYIEDQIWHNCEASPYLTGECSGSAITYDFSTDYPSPLGSVKYANDDMGPNVSNVVLNGQNVQTSDVRSKNCEDIAKYYTIGGEVDLKANINDVTSDVKSVKYKVRKVNSNGCSNSTIFSSGNVGMSNTSNDEWQDLNGFDTTGVPSDGEYTIMLKSEDSLGNVTTSYIDILVDNTAPDAFNVSPSDGAIVGGSSITQQWGSNASDVDYYVYQSFDDANGVSLRWEDEYNATSKTANNVSEAMYWWRVKAVDQVGNESPWTDLWKITVDNTAPFASFVGFQTDSTTPIISGPVDNDATSVLVTVDGENYNADVNLGTWSVSPVGPLAIGSYDVTLTAQDSAGNKTVSTFTNDDSLVINEPIVTIVSVANSNDNIPAPTLAVTQTSAPQVLPTNTGVANPSSSGQGTTEVQGANTETSSNEQDASQESGTDVEGVSTTSEVNNEVAASTSNSGFNWWWVIVLLAVLGIGYGIYRFAFVEVDES